MEKTMEPLGHGTGPRLEGDWRTLRQAAEELGTSYDALRQWLYMRSKVKRYKLDNLVVVRKSDLAGYRKQGQELVDA